MATFEDIQKANSVVTTTQIKGKEYAEVNQRIKAFRMVYPMGFIKTWIETLENGLCIMRAEVGVGDTILGTGTAYEKEGSTQINRTSYIENCETSAVGRALGMAGFGIDTSVASKEEVEQAIAQQEADKVENSRIDKAKVNVLKKKIDQDGINLFTFLTMCHVDRLEDLSFKQWQHALEHWETVKAKC